jgi:hypothetical protein
VDSRTSDVSIFMCSSGVRWILVIFDVMTRLLCVCCIFYCYVCAAFSICWVLEVPQPGRQIK